MSFAKMLRRKVQRVPSQKRTKIIIIISIFIIDSLTHSHDYEQLAELDKTIIIGYVYTLHLREQMIQDRKIYFTST